KVQVTCRAPLALLAVGHVNGVAIHRQGRFVKRLGKGRVREHHHAQVFGAGAELHGNGALLNQLGGARADHVNAQHAVGLGVGDDLDEAGGLVGGHGAAAGGERRDADVDVHALGLQRLLGLADPGDFRVGVDNARDQVVVHLGLLPGDALGDHHALFRGLVGQHGAAHHVTDGVHARHAGGAVVVDEDEAALVQGHAAVGGQQIGGHRATAHGHDQLVEGQLMFAVGVAEGHDDLLALDLGAGHTGAQADVQALLAEDLLGFLGNLIVGGGQELVHGFQHGDLGAEAGPHGTQFQADHARADHAQAAGHALEVQGAGGVDDDLLVDRSRRDLDRLGAGGQDHVLGGQHLGGTVGLADFHLLAGQQLAVAFEHGDAVGLHQGGDAAGEVFDDLVLAADHGRHVHLHVTGADAVNLEALLRLVGRVRAVKQSLGRDAADVQAGAAQGQLAFLADVLFDQGGLLAQLSRANGCDVAAGARANHYDVEFLAHSVSSFNNSVVHKRQSPDMPGSA